MMIALTIIHVVISLALIVVVLLQHGKQQGLSGAIAGGAETFFGKNKGRTVDAMLKKFTAVVAILFILSSITFAAMAINVYDKSNPGTDAAQTDTAGTDAAQQVTMDESGNLVDAEGNILMTADQVAEQQQAAEAQEGAEAGTEGTEAGTEGTDAAPETSAAPEATAASDASQTPAE